MNKRKIIAIIIVILFIVAFVFRINTVAKRLKAKEDKVSMSLLGKVFS